MVSKSKTSFCALGFFAVAFLFIFISFASPYWLETDGKLPNPKFVKLGLWQVCFNGFEDPRHWYDTVFNSCWWVFEEEHYIVNDILLPGFFVATQFFFTVAFTACLIAICLVVLFFMCAKDNEKYILLLLTLGADLVIGGLSGLISVIIFGARGDGRDWMPNWEHNNLSWGYALGVIGILLLFPAGILFLVEARVQRYKKLQEIHTRDQSEYSMDSRKVGYVGGHTDI